MVTSEFNNKAKIIKEEENDEYEDDEDKMINKPGQYLNPGVNEEEHIEIEAIDEDLDAVDAEVTSTIGAEEEVQEEIVQIEEPSMKCFEAKRAFEIRGSATAIVQPLTPLARIKLEPRSPSKSSSKSFPRLVNDESISGMGGSALKRLPIDHMHMGTKVMRKQQLIHTPKTRIATLHERMMAEVSRNGLVLETLNENGEVECGLCKYILQSETEMYEHIRAFHRKSLSKSQVVSGTLLCAHPHCSASFPDVGHLIAHLVAYHNQQQYRIRKITFNDISKFDISEIFKRIRFFLLTTIYVYFRRVAVIGCFAHLGHFKKPSWTAFSPETHDGRVGATRGPKGQTVSSRCKDCDLWFRSKTAMKKHWREVHDQRDYTGKQPMIECGDPDCDVVCDCMMTLCEHVAEAHKREDLVVEEYKRGVCVWRQIHVRNSRKHRVEYYLCHLSGYTNRLRRRRQPVILVEQQRNRHTKKMGRYCTAFMNVKINKRDGTVTMKGCLGHFGHTFDVRRLPVPDMVKKEITDLLLKGCTEDDVVTIIRGKSAENERGYYLQRYEVRNVVLKLQREGTLAKGIYRAL
uniref:C2H2-type domain-containing protein n=1 Tax=Heterorhabditis bacteriophora TaxID=37862 RepID=A0A1I7WSS8_HETBA